MDLQKIANKNHLLVIKRIQVSLSELEGGILEKYQTAILIIIGHGTPDGLSDKKDTMTWDVVQEVIEEKDARVNTEKIPFRPRFFFTLDLILGFP